MITIIDYGVGNLRSVQKALETVGAQVRISQEAEDIKNSEKVVLPGVGAIRPAMEKLESLGLIPSIRRAKLVSIKPAILPRDPSKGIAINGIILNAFSNGPAFLSITVSKKLLAASINPALFEIR